MRYYYIFIFVLVVAACKGKKEEQKTAEANPFYISYSIKRALPHNEDAYTQGLVFDGNQLYESTGQAGSWIATVDLESGVHSKKVILDDRFFGEGIAVLNDKIYQLTWQNRQGFVYDKNTFREIRKFFYTFEGWGITTDGKQLIISDGSDKLYFMDTIDFKVNKTLTVKAQGLKVDKLNELEYVDGFVWSNQWQTDYIYKIDLTNGNVIGQADFSTLSNEIRRENDEADVLNGIAYNPITKDFLITGKLWHKAFIVQMK